MRLAISNVIALALITTSLAAQTAPPPHLRLLPVTRSAVPGANGSVWVTEHYAHNHSDSTMWITNNFDCRWSAEHACDVPVPPRGTVRIATAYIGADSYEFWGVKEGAVGAFTVTSFVRNVNGDADPWGTALPVAETNDFHSQPVHIAPMPADPAYRVSLRVWAWTGTPDAAAAAVEIVSIDEFGKQGSILGSISLPRGSQGSYFEAHDVLSQVPGRTAHSRVALRVSIPSAPSALVWAFASVTHNESQHVTIFTP